MLQVLGFKKIAGSSTDRYRVFVSDGKYSNSYSMLATQMNNMIDQLSKHTIIKWEKGSHLPAIGF